LGVGGFIVKRTIPKILVKTTGEQCNALKPLLFTGMQFSGHHKEIA